MRLICPNCDAEYEIDDAAIPRTGRDVQCSNCGHAWFQAHPEVEAAEEAEADLYDAPPGAVVAGSEDAVAAEPLVEAVSAPVTAPDSVPTPEPVEDDEPAEDPPAPPPPPQARTLDETVLAVLREEAEREQAARKAEAAPQPVIETQTEMPLAQDAGGMAATVRRIAKLRGAAEPEPVVPVEPPTPKSRGQLLPAIEEINSTLRATSSRTLDDDGVITDTMAEPKAARGSFRRGFVTLVMLAVLIVVLYVLAPLIKAKVPALAGTMDAYVAAVNAARVWLDGALQSLVTTLRGYAGGQGG